MGYRWCEGGLKVRVSSFVRAGTVTVMGYLITVMGHSMANPITVMENLISVMADNEASGQPQRAVFGPRMPRLGHPCLI